MFQYQVDGKLLEDIRLTENKGLALGNDKFKEQIALLTGQRKTQAKRGRKEGWCKLRDDE
ncbi:hypothetical protein [Marinomonas sp. TW1]|uniref:hypothetical protein n=1 Tax=Marinomonas sp. TW1 TaxID=1561203 RepID=UPI0007AF9FF9|nr:hypothetical protein [Marinomonas sp. TW1]